MARPTTPAAEAVSQFVFWDTLKLTTSGPLVLMHAVEVPSEGKMRLAGAAEDDVMRYRDAAQREAQHRLRQLAADAGLDVDRVRLCTSECMAALPAHHQRTWSSLRPRPTC